MPAAELPEKVTFTRVGLLFTVLKRAPPLGDAPEPPVQLIPAEGDVGQSGAALGIVDGAALGRGAVGARRRVAREGNVLQGEAAGRVEHGAAFRKAQGASGSGGVVGEGDAGEGAVAGIVVHGATGKVGRIAGEGDVGQGKACLVVVEGAAAAIEGAIADKRNVGQRQAAGGGAEDSAAGASMVAR